jgi:cytidylate kinase
MIIAIDGYSACGKSTLAKALGKVLHFAYIDTGAMYRAVTLYFLRHSVDLTDEKQVQDALAHIEIHFEREKTGNHVFLNGEDIEAEIRKMYVSDSVSQVAAISEVRRQMVRLQQAMGHRRSLIMDGRDIGTVVFPNADLKIFLTADSLIRTQRRVDELKSKGQEIDFEAVRKNLQERDRIDSTRLDSPLRQADDAILIDNTQLTPDEQLQKVLELVTVFEKQLVF